MDKIIVDTKEEVIKKTTTSVTIPTSQLTVYKDLHKCISHLLPGTSAELLLFLLIKMDNEGCIKLNDEFIKLYNEVAPNVSERSFYRLVKMLVDASYLTRIERGVYKISNIIVYGVTPVSFPKMIDLISEEVVSNKPSEVIPLEDDKSVLIFPTIIDKVRPLQEKVLEFQQEIQVKIEEQAEWEVNTKALEDVVIKEETPKVIVSKGLRLEDIVLPVVEERKKPTLNLGDNFKNKLNLNGSKTLKI